MVMGAMWYFMALDRVDLAEETFQYGLDHLFIMDPRDKSISYLIEDSQFTLALIVHRLGGKDFTVWRFGAPCIGTLGGFEGHLQALTLAQRAVLDFGDGEACINEMVERHPSNAFFQAIKGLYTGDQSVATELLLNEAWWPADRLPTTDDRCDDWITQRDEGDDWLPCPERNKTHSGGDFLFAAALVLGKF
jgi:hypothetical protein